MARGKLVDMLGKLVLVTALVLVGGSIALTFVVAFLWAMTG